MEGDVLMKKKVKFHLPLRAYLLYLVLVSLVLTGVTFSRYITSSYGGDSARVVKMGNLSITHSDSIVAPGVDLNKEIEVQLNKSEMDCYVFLVIDCSNYHYDEPSKEYQYKIESKSVLDWKIDLEWKYLNRKENEIIYYQKIQANQEAHLNILLDKVIHVSKNIKASEVKTLESFKFNIKASAVQCGSFTPNEAYQAIMTK